jgi:exopolyphosphatase/guanosine-5'-triphosphate,3'-diphosphate pyrophosphatase
MPTAHTEFPKKTIAAIDIGTNSAHLVIAEMDHVGEMRVLDSDKVMLRLGQAIGPDGNLSESGIERTVAALSHMREIIKPFKATIRAVATYATREARNHKKLLQRVEQEAGIKVELIDGIEEARLAFLGMRYGLILEDTPCLGVDVGGGSTEIIIARNDEINYVSSFKLGAVVLTDKHFVKGGYDKDSLAHIREHVHSRLAPLQTEAKRHKFTKAIASSGTAKALAYFHARLYDGGAINDPNGYVIPRDHLFAMVDKLQQLLTPQKIKDGTGIDSSRAEIIVAGAMILEEVTRLLKVNEWIVTSYGLREGLVADTFYRTYGRTSKELPDIQWHSVLQLARRLELDQAHAIQVKRLALRIYEQLGRHLRERDGDKEDDHDENIKLLKAAAYLREAGKFISAPQYHRHSQYLLSNSRLPGFTEPERTMMGLIARFQRKQTPSQDNCEELAKPELQRLKHLSGCLRLAAALDRTRQSRVTDIAIDLTKSLAKVRVFHELDRFPDVELHKARLELEALEKSFGLPLTLEAVARKTKE